MGTVFFDSDDVGYFEPQQQGTTGNITLDTTNAGTFTLANIGAVYFDSTVVGDYVALPPGLADARSSTKTWVNAYWEDTNVTKDDHVTPAATAIMYAFPPYPLAREFYASSNPVDGLILVGEPDSTPLLGHDQKPYGYLENVPIFLAAIDKAGITGTKLKWKMEKELRRITENYAFGSYRTLDRRGDRDQRLGSTVIYITEYVLRYERVTA